MSYEVLARRSGGNVTFVTYFLHTHIMLRLAKKGVANHHPFGANFTCMTFELTRKIVGAAELSGKGGPVLGRPTFPLIAYAKQDNESGSLQFVNRNPKNG